MTHSKSIRNKFQNLFSILILAFLASSFSCSLLPNQPIPVTEVSARGLPKPVKGFSIRDGKLIDRTNEVFTIKGVNFGFGWFKHLNYREILKTIRSTNANTVRIVLQASQRWSSGRTSGESVRAVVDACIANQMVAIVEVHDTSGYYDKDGKDAISLDKAVDYWLSEDVKAALFGKEDKVIVNLGNEPHGNGIGPSRWYAETAAALKRMRAGGYKHTLMIDGPNWGQDNQHIMRNSAGRMFNEDPDRNMIFSIHPWMHFKTSDIGGTYASFSEYVKAYVTNKLPLVVGEFSIIHHGVPIDAHAILNICATNKLGYLGWTWKGDTDEPERDLVKEWYTLTATTPGQILFDSPNGLRSAETCKVFNHKQEFASGTVLKYAYTYSRNGEDGKEGFSQKNTYLTSQRDVQSFQQRNYYPSKIMLTTGAKPKVRLDYSNNQDVEFNFDLTNPYKVYNITKINNVHSMNVQMQPDGSWRISEGGGGPGWGYYQMLVYTAE